MSTTKQGGLDVSRMARLAMLELTPAEEQNCAAELGIIDAQVARLATVDTTGVEPMIFGNNVRNAFREDQRRDWAEPGLALDNAPELSGDEIRVPKMVEQE